METFLLGFYYSKREKNNIEKPINKTKYTINKPEGLDFHGKIRNLGFLGIYQNEVINEKEFGFNDKLSFPFYSYYYYYYYYFLSTGVFSREVACRRMIYSWRKQNAGGGVTV